LIDFEKSTPTASALARSSRQKKTPQANRLGGFLVSWIRMPGR